MKTQLILIRGFAAALLLLATALGGCAARHTPVRAQLRPAQILDDAPVRHDWAATIEESQNAAAASWRL